MGLRIMHANGARFFLFVYLFTLDEDYIMVLIYLYIHDW